MTLPPEILTLLVLLALAMGAIALLAALGNNPKGGRKLSESREAVVMLSEHDQAIAKLHQAVRRIAGQQRAQGEAFLGVIQKVGLVRYDAYEDMGGHLSFSTALLDQSGNGLVITSINGRQDTRVYAKPVRGGISQHNLSVEEQEAIRQALGQDRSPVAAPS